MLVFCHNFFYDVSHEFIIKEFRVFIEGGLGQKCVVLQSITKGHQYCRLPSTQITETRQTYISNIVLCIILNSPNLPSPSKQNCPWKQLLILFYVSFIQSTRIQDGLNMESYNDVNCCLIENSQHRSAVLPTTDELNGASMKVHVSGGTYFILFPKMFGNHSYKNQWRICLSKQSREFEFQSSF